MAYSELLTIKVNYAQGDSLMRKTVRKNLLISISSCSVRSETAGCTRTEKKVRV